MKKELNQMSAIELLEYVIKLPYLIDKATVPKAGIMKAPEQVVLNMSVPWLWLENARNLVAQHKGNLTTNAGDSAVCRCNQGIFDNINRCSNCGGKKPPSA